MQHHVPGWLIICNCCAAVPQDKFYAVERFGEFDYMLKPGLSCVGFDMCGICIKYRAITKRVEQNDCVVETKTKDNVFVSVRVAVQQSVDPERVESAIYRLSDVGAQVDAYVADVVRSQVPSMDLDEVFVKKDHISDAVQDLLGRHMTDYGFQIHKALVTEISPNREVMNAMNEINKQERLRQAAVMAGEADKVRVVKAAEAASDAACLQGEGIARQRAAIVKGLRDAIQEGSADVLTTDRISELLLISQYFETLREIGANSKSQAVFLPQSPTTGMADIAGQIRSGVMQGELGLPPGRPTQQLMT